MDGLGLELRIFNLTHQKRSEAKVDLRGYVTNMSNLRSMLKGSGTQQPPKAFLQIMKYPPGVAEHAHPDGFPRDPAAAPRNTAVNNVIMSIMSLFPCLF